MKCRRLGRIRFSEEFLEDLGANRELLGAYAKSMAPYIVISSTYDKVHEAFEQVLIDPLGTFFGEVPEGALIPEYRVVISKLQPVDLYSPLYHCYLTPAVKGLGTNSAGPM